MVIYEANSTKMTLQNLLLDFVRIKPEFICSIHLHIFIYAFEVQNLSILRKYFQEFSHRGVEIINYAASGFCIRCQFRP